MREALVLAKVSGAPQAAQRARAARGWMGPKSRRRPRRKQRPRARCRSCCGSATRGADRFQAEGLYAHGLEEFGRALTVQTAIQQLVWAHNCGPAGAREVALEYVTHSSDSKPACHPARRGLSSVLSVRAGFSVFLSLARAGQGTPRGAEGLRTTCVCVCVCVCLGQCMYVSDVVFFKSLHVNKW